MARKRLATEESAQRLVGRRRPRISHARAQAWVTALLSSDTTHVLRFRDLCRLAEVSERTLRTIFLESFGMSPGRYLRARKLGAIRAALMCADSRYETVSKIAARYGMSDLGRMAKDYQVHFGEYPRATLARAITP
jgi:AraC family transcriptional regulator, ethanolamine operon transcriptional activator